tara:strand:+ start:2063 stop:3265 length:1203 start_codon:yes stop_codon:yes gene_type:complete
MRWIAFTLLACLAAALWWLDDPWPERSVAWDQRYGEAAGREDCAGQLALIRVGIEAHYPPAASALGELAVRNACGYQAGQFSFEDQDVNTGEPVMRDWLERRLRGYAGSTSILRHDLNNGWFLRNQVMAWFETRSQAASSAPHAALLHLVRSCADLLLPYSASPHWAALENALQAARPDSHQTATEIFQHSRACREIEYQTSVTLRQAESASLRERGRLMHSVAASDGHPQAIAECLALPPLSEDAGRQADIEPAVYCRLDAWQMRHWARLGNAAARTAWLDSVDLGAWADGGDGGWDAPTPVWVAIHATIGDHPIREAALSSLPAGCAQIVDAAAARLERLQTAQAPLPGLEYDEQLREVWPCEPAALRAVASFEAYYPEEGIPAFTEQWTTELEPRHP